MLAKIYRLAVFTAEGVVAGNSAAAAIFTKSGLHPQRLLIAPQMGVDEGKFQAVSSEKRRALRKDAALPEEDFVVGFCGRFESQKGVFDLVEAVKIARERPGVPPLTLALIGHGPLGEDLRRLAEKHAWLRLCPPRDHSEIAAFFQMLDLLVLPSVELHENGHHWKEQFGHVLIEAMSSGVPALGSDSGAIPEVLGDSPAIFPAGNPQALAELLVRLATDPAELDALTKRQTERVHERFTNAKVARRWIDFCQLRIAARRKSILWVDPHLTENSPSMKHLLHSIGYLRENGWSIQAWCYQSEASPDEIEVTKIPRPRLPGPLLLWGFFFSAHLYGFGYWLFHGHSPARIVHTMGGLYLGANMSSTHFVNHVWLRKQWELGLQTPKDLWIFFFTILGVIMDQLQFSNRHCRLFLSVSDSIGKEVRQRCHPNAIVKTLPNSYDETRFNLAARELYRSSMRESLGYGPEDCVFCFVSQGHHRRKGFWLAVQALAELRRESKQNIKFLVVGGNTSALQVLRETLTVRYPDWESWLQLAGMQVHVERYFAASDAFLFLSYFEAFCLAEIEAAKMGLPLLLTPHHGSEMVLRDRLNGLIFPYDNSGIKEKLVFFLENRSMFSDFSGARSLNRKAYTELLLAAYLSLHFTLPGQFCD